MTRRYLSLRDRVRATLPDTAACRRLGVVGRRLQVGITAPVPTYGGMQLYQDDGSPFGPELTAHDVGIHASGHGFFIDD